MVDSVSWDELIDQAGDSVASTFEPLPKDDYNLEVVDSTFKWTTTGKKMWNVQYKVIDGDHKNRRLFNNIVLSPENDTAVQIFFRNMACHGLTVDYFKSKPADEAVASAMVGRRLRAKVVQKPYQGDMKNEIERYLKALDVEAPPSGSVSSAPASAAPPAPAAPPVGTTPPPGVTPPPVPGDMPF